MTRLYDLQLNGDEARVLRAVLREVQIPEPTNKMWVASIQQKLEDVMGDSPLSLEDELDQLGMP
jgi:hypothetical protein